MAEWEAEIKIRRNGRLVQCDSAVAETPAFALYLAHNDLGLWCQAHPENDPESQDVDHA